MTSEDRGPAGATRGLTSNGVPFVALPPGGGKAARGLVILWHGADPPRTEEALAAAVPMRGLEAWRAYLGMPGHGVRSPRGGVEEIMRLAAQDALTLLFRPRIQGAVDELRGAVDDLRSRLGINAALPLGIFGFSQGGEAALLAVSRHLLPFRAAVTFGATIDMTALIDTLAAHFGMPYEWTEERRVLARELSSHERAQSLAGSGTAILMAAGEKDDFPTGQAAEKLAAAIQAAGGIAEARIVPALAHAFVDEPGEAPAPQGDHARAVDLLATNWFKRHL